ncbi:DUF397 domain-containing protein [Streptomyces sp. SID3343]|uniref:DUF397 domain-containing protein n=1 Tax=Streptomyces sp. SID3343 TaxID=2690260 RepID=UPI001369D02A|nr:DUF397 domain-containing protein [Streptomyces sp. SID3343]MYV97039.1 DUF397 domain-containing protein [Streptomyces sp. SID3343]
MTTAPIPSSAKWRKSTFSNPDGGSCLEVAPGFAVVPVRDSKDPSIGHLTVAAASWSALLSSLRPA